MTVSEVARRAFVEGLLALPAAGAPSIDKDRPAQTHDSEAKQISLAQSQPVNTHVSSDAMAVAAAGASAVSDRDELARLRAETAQQRLMFFNREAALTRQNTELSQLVSDLTAQIDSLRSAADRAKIESDERVRRLTAEKNRAEAAHARVVSELEAKISTVKTEAERKFSALQATERKTAGGERRSGATDSERAGE